MSTATLTPATSSVPRINDTAPDFTAETTQGPIHFHEWIGNGWAVLFSHPKDFTPVCTTELGAMAKLQPEFAKRNTKILALSVDPVGDHVKWQSDIEETQGAKVNYPMIGDPQLSQNFTACCRLLLAIARKAALRMTMPPCARCSSSVRTRRSKCSSATR